MLCLKRMDADCSAAIISDLNTGPSIDCFIGTMGTGFQKKKKKS